MSDIRFNRWLHQSGTGGVYQAGSGNVGIGSSVPSTTLAVNGTISATSVSATSISSASASFSGDVTVGGKLTYDDVTNIDSVGVITARSGINVSSGNIVVGSAATITSAGAITAIGFADFKRPAANGFGYLGIGPGGANEKAIFVNRSGEIDLELYSNYSTNPTLSLNSDGSAIFSGIITAAGALLRSTSTSDGPSLQFDGAGPNGTNYIFGKIEGDNTGSNNAGELRFYTNLASAGGLTQRMVIARDGKIGIGTINPSQELTVYGADPIISVQEASASSQVDIGTGTVTGFINIQKADGTRTIQINGNDDSYFTGGDFGVGTASPTARFDVRRGDTDGKIAEFHQSAGYGFDIGSSQTEAYIASGYLQSFIIKTDPSSGQVERMRIDKDGKLLVGTTSNFIRGQIQVIDGGGGELTIGRNDTTVTSGNDLGHLFFASNDENGTGVIAASMNAYADLNHTSASAPTRLTFSTTAANATSPTERMRIDSSGVVTQPYQPRFFATLSSTYSGYDGRNIGNSWITFNNTIYNEGGHFKTSGGDQGRFVAPVNGMYLFRGSCYKGTSTSNWSQSWLDVDGSRADGTDWVVGSSRHVENYCQIYLTAGQKVGFHPYNNAQNNQIIATNNHTYFRGCLLH